LLLINGTCAVVFTNHIKDVVLSGPHLFYAVAQKILRDNANEGHTRASSKCNLSREEEKSQKPSYLNPSHGKTSSFSSQLRLECYFQGRTIILLRGDC